MLKKCLFIAWTFLSLQAVAQDTSSAAYKKNLFKVNLTSLPLGNFSLQYERAVARKISVAVGVRFMPEGKLPLKGTIQDLIDDQETKDQLENFRTSNFALTPEVRFYLGNKPGLRGFYVAPYARYATFKADLPSFEYDYNGTEHIIPLSGSLKTFSGGLMLGAQWKLGGAFYLDWWIIGAHYGSSNGTIKGSKDLSNAMERQAVENEVRDLDLPFTKVDKVTVSNTGVQVDFKGNWAGARGGITLGIAF